MSRCSAVALYSKGCTFDSRIYANTSRLSISSVSKFDFVDCQQTVNIVTTDCVFGGLTQFLLVCLSCSGIYLVVVKSTTE